MKLRGSLSSWRGRGREPEFVAFLKRVSTIQINSEIDADAAPTASHPLVSVIIPTFNYGQFIGQTLESVQAQTYQNWECVVVDDDSTDNTPQVVTRYAVGDNRIKYLHQINQRQAAARNHGLQHATGKYVQFLDADDLIEPYKLERQVGYLEQHPEVDIVYSSVRYFSSENIHERLFSMGKDNSPWMPEVSGAGQDILSLLVRANIMAVNSPLVRRSVVDDVGPFDHKLPPLEDWDFWLRCAVKGKRFQHDKTNGTLALVRSHPASSSRNKTRMMRAGVRMRRKLEQRIDDAEIRKLNRELMSEDAWCLGVEEVLHGSVLRGTGGLIEAGIGERRLNHRMKMFVCAFIAPFVSKQRFQVVASSSITSSLTGIWRRSGAE